MIINQLKAGALLSYVLLGLNTLIGLLYTPFLLRMLGKSEYGLYSLAASVIAYLTVLDLGFGNAIVRYTAKFRAEGKKEEQYEMFGMFFLLYLVISLIAFIVAMIMVGNVDAVFDANMTAGEVSRMRIILLLMAFNLAFTFPMSIWGSIITAYENFVFQKSINIARTLLNPLVMVGLLFWGYKAVALVVVTTIFNVLTLCINYIYCKRKLRVKLYFKRFKWGFLKEVSIYSFWIFLNAITEQIYWGSGQFILGVFQGTAAVAVYAVAIQLKNMYYMFSTAISTVLLPKVTAMVTKGVSEKEVSDMFIRTGRLQYIVMSFILTGFILLGRPFIQMWAGIGYDQAYLIALLFFIPTFVPLIQNLGITILMAQNRLRFRSLLILIASVLSLLVAIPCSKKWGAIGCAMATSLAIVFAYGIILNIYYQIKIHIDIKRFWREIGRMSIVPLLIIAGGWCLVAQSDIQGFSCWGMACLLLGMVYIPLFYRFSMNDYERELFKKPVKAMVRKIQRKTIVR
ncbi:oligosaccharide flippase family protein [Parabacteroides sp. ZJ-118]|uniref:oligosaccharide flippase family protein n=1 Tax=Parabacteroides sp. ZJ-118 TaxID=2709398 RepID=UPI0013EDF610|nr:oligosaccharide flippase family protein [Parabacteroides sp. ZJ-118]